MRLVVLGCRGQLAQELARLAPRARFLGRDEADLDRPDTLGPLLRALAPEAVINAAAWTAVDAAETDEVAAHRVNALAPATMARACAELGIPLVHVSTDYVFDGAGDRPFAPDDPTAPLGAYGRTKLAGEVGVRAAGGRHAILRTSWVFSAQGTNFLRTMLRLGAEREVLRVVDDQIGGPTPADDLARACLSVLAALCARPGLSGTWHFSGAPDVSWADFARAIMDAAGLACRIEGIPSSDYPTPARRPANSRLDCTATRDDFGLVRPDWREGVTRVLARLRG